MVGCQNITHGITAVCKTAVWNIGALGDDGVYGAKQMFFMTMSGNIQQERVKLREDVYKPGQLVKHEFWTLRRSRSMYWFSANVFTKVENTKIHHLAGLHQGTALKAACSEGRKRNHRYVLPANAINLLRSFSVDIVHFKNPARSGWHGNYCSPW